MSSIAVFCGCGEVVVLPCNKRVRSKEDIKFYDDYFSDHRDRDINDYDLYVSDHGHVVQIDTRLVYGVGREIQDFAEFTEQE